MGSVLLQQGSVAIEVYDKDQREHRKHFPEDSVLFNILYSYKLHQNPKAEERRVESFRVDLSCH